MMRREVRDQDDVLLIGVGFRYLEVVDIADVTPEGVRFVVKPAVTRVLPNVLAVTGQSSERV